MDCSISCIKQKNVKIDEIYTILDPLNNMKNLVFLHPIQRRRKMSQSPKQGRNRNSGQNQGSKEQQKVDQRMRVNQSLKHSEQVKLSHLDLRSPLSPNQPQRKPRKTQTPAPHQSLNQQNNQLAQLHNLIKKHQCQKIQYQQQIYELSLQKSHLTQQNKKLKQQLNDLKKILLQKEMQVQQVRVKLKKNEKNNNCLDSGLLVQDNSQQKQQLVGLRQYKQQRQQLEQILKDFQTKVAKYQKQLTKKQALHNHQHYLLQKLKNQHQQLHLNQNALLQELQYVLKKNKTLKKQNQLLKQTDEKRVMHLMELEESNAKLMHDIKELFGKINELEREKVELQEHLALVTCQMMKNRLNFNSVITSQDIQITKVKAVDQNTKQSQNKQIETEPVEQHDKVAITHYDQSNSNENQLFYQKEQSNHQSQPQKQTETNQMSLKLSL